MFTIYAGIAVEKIKVFRFFNRWGKEVYNATNFSPNDDAYGWDAKRNEKKDDIGVYIYFVEVLYVDGRTEIFKGDVLLTRWYNFHFTKIELKKPRNSIIIIFYFSNYF